MPDLEIKIGDRAFHVACQPGEEHYLKAAAGMLDAEAQPLIAQMGRLPEARMLLMAGLMLADKTAAVEDEAKKLRARIAELEADPSRKVEVPTVPADLLAGLAELAEKADRVADQVLGAKNA